MATSSESIPSSGSFASEFEKMLRESVDAIRPGKVVKGTVVGVNKEVAHVDIGFKSDGVVPISQFQDAKGALQAKVGDEVDVYI
jgi:small subunit ribosomal protein S1